jgi:hypothetical protein
MTAEEVHEALVGKQVILHKGQIFFNSRSYEEVALWQQQGAKIVPFYPLTELERSQRLRKYMGWEVHVLPMLDPEWVPLENGEDGEVNIAPERLLGLCRAA